jgi:hypothetical protein
MPEPGEGRQRELSEADIERKYDDEVAESAREVLARANPNIDGAIVYLGMAQAEMDAAYESPDIDAAQHVRIEDPLGGVRDNAGREDIERRLRAVEDVLQRNNAGAPDEAERKKENVRKFLLFFGLASIALSVATLILTAVHRCAAGRSDDDLPLPGGVKARIRELVDAWKGMSEVDFWAQMGKYAKVSGAAFADLIFFMQYTKQLAPLQVPFYWSSYSDQDAFVARLVQAYRTQDIAALFNLLPTLEYRQDGRPGAEKLPRFYCADLAQMALGELAQ